MSPYLVKHVCCGHSLLLANLLLTRYYVSTLAEDPGQRHLMRSRLDSEDAEAECLTCPPPHQPDTNHSGCARFKHHNID